MSTWARVMRRRPTGGKNSARRAEEKAKRCASSIRAPTEPNTTKRPFNGVRFRGAARLDLGGRKVLCRSVEHSLSSRSRGSLFGAAADDDDDAGINSVQFAPAANLQKPLFMDL